MASTYLQCVADDLCGICAAKSDVAGSPDKRYRPGNHLLGGVWNRIPDFSLLHIQEGNEQVNLFFFLPVFPIGTFYK